MAGLGRPDKPPFGCPRYANRQIIQRGMQSAALPAREDSQRWFQPRTGSAIKPVLLGQRVIPKTCCGRRTVRSDDAPPKTLTFSQDNEGRPPGLSREGHNWSDGSH